MTIEGPDGIICYLPYEAYEVTGRQLYRSNWQSPFFPGKPLPDPVGAKNILETDGPEADWLRSFSPPDSAEYRLLQIKSVRTDQTLNKIRDPLSYGKFSAYRQKPDGWEKIQRHEWDTDGSAFDEFLDALNTYYRDHARCPESIIIEELGLNHWLRRSQSLPVDPTEPLAPTRPRGRPRFQDWDVLEEELLRLHRESQLPRDENTTKIALCKLLYRRYQREYGKKPPKPATIRDNLKNLDRIFQEYYRA